MEHVQLEQMKSLPFLVSRQDSHAENVLVRRQALCVVSVCVCVFAIDACAHTENEISRGRMGF